MKQYLLVKNIERDKKIIELYIHGANQKNVSKLIGISQSSVSHILKKNNIESNYLRNGKNNSNWKGGIRYDRNRKTIYSPNHPNCNAKGYCYEYVLIMEEYLGRFLKKGEIVHHINGDITDNRLDNLQVMTQSEHVNVHRKQGDFA